MSLNEHMVNLGQFIVVCLWNIKMRCQTDVIRVNLGKWLYLRMTLDCFNERCDNLLFNYRCWLFCLNVYHGVFRCLELVKL